MMNKIIDTINGCKKKSTVPIIDNQIAYIPVFEDNQIEYMTFDYYRDGQLCVVHQGYEACFKLRYMNFKFMEPRKFCNYVSGSWSLEWLVDDKVIEPFMLFINGKFIPWPLISIHNHCGNYYILVDTSRDNIFTPEIRDVKYAQIITLPDHMRAYSDGTTFGDTVFSFDENGLFSFDRPVHTVENINDKHHMDYSFYTTDVGVNAFEVTDDRSLKLTGKNVIVFKDGLLYCGPKENIKKGFDAYYKDEETGHESPCIEFKVSDEELEPNPTIKFDSELLTIGDGTVEDGSILDFGVFTNTDYTPTIDNIHRVELDALAPYVMDQTSGANDPQFLKDLQVPFEMQMDRAKHYDENVVVCVRTMMSYNASLFNSVIKENSNLLIEQYTGANVIERALANTETPGTWIVPRDHSDNYEECIFMLVNGEMYQYIKFAKYKANTWLVPIQGIEESDVVELLRFQRINNSETSLTVNEDDGFQYYSPDIINEDMVLFSTETNDTYFNFPVDGLQHFPVDYTLETDDEGLIKINLTNPFYYGKKLVVTCKNRYKHFTFRLEGSSVGQYKVDLEDKFMYCNEYSKYLVFYNGRRLNTDNFRLTLPVRSTTPFYRFSIYLTMPVEDGDIIDVIYVPSLMKDVALLDTIPTNGDIIIDKSAIGYGLSTYLYMAWINGKKIPEGNIVDIDSTHLKIIADTETTDTVSITMYIPEIEILSNAFRENEALWDKVFAQLSNEEICTLLGIDETVLTNTEPSIYADAIHIRTIMFELIREEFIMNPNVDITEPFVYDYQDVDQTAIEDYDAAGNAILPVSDANRTDNLDDVERPWP